MSDGASSSPARPPHSPLRFLTLPSSLLLFSSPLQFLSVRIPVPLIPVPVLYTPQTLSRWKFTLEVSTYSHSNTKTFYRVRVSAVFGSRWVGAVLCLELFQPLNRLSVAMECRLFECARQHRRITCSCCWLNSVCGLIATSSNQSRIMPTQAVNCSKVAYFSRCVCARVRVSPFVCT